MLTDRQKTLLMIQTNLDQIEAGIRHGLEDPEYAGEDKTVGEPGFPVTEPREVFNIP